VYKQAASSVTITPTDRTDLSSDVSIERTEVLVGHSLSDAKDRSETAKSIGWAAKKSNEFKSVLEGLYRDLADFTGAPLPSFK
jgi:hypothetical protein